MITTALLTLATVAQLGTWTYDPGFDNGRGAAFYPGQGRINLALTCPRADLAAVSITVDGGRFANGTVLAEWNGRDLSIHEARVLGNGSTLGLADDPGRVQEVEHAVQPVGQVEIAERVGVLYQCADQALRHAPQPFPLGFAAHGFPRPPRRVRAVARAGHRRPPRSAARTWRAARSAYWRGVP